MADRTLPHDPYIAAVITGLTVAGLEPDDYWTSDGEINPYDDGPDAGLTTMLNAVLTWDSDEEADQAGLLLLWDHPAEQWQYARPRPEGGNTEPEFLPRLGRWSHPDAVVATARALLSEQPVPEGHAPYWHQADAVQAAVAAWEQADAAGPAPDRITGIRRDRLTEIAARAAAATKGPWTVERDEPTLSRLVCNEDRTLEIDFGYVGNNTQPDAEFVAHAREDVPWLLAELEKYVGHEPTVAEEMQYSSRCIAALGTLADRLDEMATEQDRRADCAPLGALVAVNDARSRANRGAARAIKAVLNTGYLPHDLMSDAELEQHGPAGDGGDAG